MSCPVPKKSDICGKVKPGRAETDDIRICVLPRRHPGPCRFAEPGSNKWTWTTVMPR